MAFFGWGRRWETPRVSRADGIASSDARHIGGRGGGVGERLRSASDETFAVPQPVLPGRQICACS